MFGLQMSLPALVIVGAILALAVVAIFIWAIGAMSKP